MGNTPTKHMVPVMDGEFIPFEAFEAYTRNDNTPTHYQSAFSIALLIEKLRAQSDSLQKSTLLQTIATLEKAEAKFQNTSESWEALCQLDEVEPLTAHIFPSFFFAGQMGFVKGPFERFSSFRFQTPAFIDLQEDDRDWEIKVNPHKMMKADMQTVLMAGSTVLNRFYNQEVNVFANEGMVL